MRLRHVLAAAAIAALLVPGTALAAAAAAPPNNDIVSGARTIGSTPKTITENTTSATTDAVDSEINASCGAPATNGSVWFKYVDTTGKGLLVDASASDYSTGIIIVAGNPTSGGTLVACGPQTSAATGPAGTTYYVMVFSDTAVIGGQLTATFSEAPPAPTATLKVDKDAIATINGSLRVHGTYSCTNADTFNSGIQGQATQRAGQLKINGFFFLSGLTCDGRMHGWKAVATSDNGYFAAGLATSSTLVFACGLVECAQQEVHRNLTVTDAH